MNMNNALKLTCAGIAGGFILRLVTMLYFYDYETGFFTDNGLLAWATIIFIAVIWIFSIVCCFKDKEYFTGSYSPGRNIFSGLISLLSAVSLAFMAYVQRQQHQSLLMMQAGSINAAQTGGIHIAFILVSALMALLQLAVSISFFTGKDFFKSIPVVHLIGVFWGIINILFTFLYYAKSALTTENIFMMIGAATLLFSLLYISKTAVGLGDVAAVRRYFIMGIPAVMLNITYNLSNLVLNLMGREYMDMGEIPFAVQTANLFVAFYILAFLFTFKSSSSPKNGDSSAST